MHESIYEPFLALLKAKISAVKFGDRSTDESLMGPLVNASSQKNIHAMVERAVAAGAVLETGGVLPAGPGHFYP
ncbi:aldehyde dehydrogenase family protein, partial [Salmonella enterica]|uniref:aldehyde dehydrogenase family protein n=1 Tax=Salmonella enterica TaxID=28901 RepID=UPI0022B693E5